MKKLLTAVCVILVIWVWIILFVIPESWKDTIKSWDNKQNNHTSSTPNLQDNNKGNKDFSDKSIYDTITVNGIIELSNFSDMRTDIPDQLKNNSTIFFTPDAESDFAQWVFKTHPTRHQNNLPRLFLWCISDGIHGHAELLWELATNKGEFSTGFRWFSFEPMDFTLPPHITGYHTVTITMPLMFLDKIKDVDLPDRARPGDCTADSKIISIDNQVIIYK